MAGLVAFGLAWVLRLIDLRVGPALPMGSHWPSHVFAAATALLIEYFYRVEGRSRC